MRDNKGILYSKKICIESCILFTVIIIAIAISKIIMPDIKVDPIGYYQTDVGNLSAEFYSCDFGILTNIERINIFDEENIPIKCNPERME
jgi:hypothetical protein